MLRSGNVVVGHLEASRGTVKGEKFNREEESGSSIRIEERPLELHLYLSVVPKSLLSVAFEDGCEWGSGPRPSLVAVPWVVGGVGPNVLFLGVSKIRMGDLVVG